MTCLYQPVEVSTLGGDWLKRYVERAVSEYQSSIKCILPAGDFETKLKYLVGEELALKRKGYYLTIGFLDEPCKLCKSCTRPITCDNPLGRPHWGLIQDLRDKYDPKKGEGLLLIGPSLNETLSSGCTDGSQHELAKIKDEIRSIYHINVYSLPANKLPITWMTVLQCMYGCRVYSNFSRRWSCVPFCPNPDETKRIVSSYKHALILNKAFRPPIFSNRSWLGFNPLRDVEQKAWATYCYGNMNAIALRVEEFLAERGFTTYTYGMSPCHVCMKCTYPSECKVLPKLRFSADASGIDIYASARMAGVDFEIPPLRRVNLLEIILLK